MTEPEGDCPNVEIDNTNEEILKELAALKDSIRKTESSCNKSMSFLEIETDAVGQELCNLKKSNNSTNYQIGTLVAEIEKCKTDIMEIREMILHIDYWLSNSGIKEESENSNIQNLKKENEELKKRNDELRTENQLIGIKNLEDEFCRDAFNMTIDSYSQENHKLKKAFGAINMILNQVQG